MAEISPDQLYEQWLRQFVANSVADDASAIQRHIKHLAIGCSREVLIAGTGQLVASVVAYLSLDGNPIEAFLKRQSYRAPADEDSHYILTFDMGQGHFGRLITDRKMTDVDFADLFGHPWEPYETAGFTDVYVSRLDRARLGDIELAEIEQRFTQDIYFDYGDDEVATRVERTALEDTALASASDIA